MNAQVERLFREALDRPERERAAYLDEACAGNEVLRREVDSLLRHDQQARSSFLQSPPLGLVDDVIGEGSAEAGSIGPYRLIQKLGEGGMGQVWLAEQAAPLQRQVAVKLIRAGMYDPSLLQRFQAERQSLALMDHPAIAKVFDAGATSGGQPYFVMEYVPGVPIDSYSDQKRLTIRERLELFIQVCEGVQHAHQKAIIHRDLKPANILVVEVDGKPTPRIIDFGLAKAASPLPGDDMSLTRVGGFVGTPGYMSPEQADPSVRDVDTRTDVYSLGVVLYVLLTGFPPHDARQWKALPYDEALRRLREDDPLRPSTRVSTDRQALTEVAQCRHLEPKDLVSRLRGDLDWITMKALEKDRDRRYGTPLGLAADLGRYLRNEPVVAAPPGTLYRARKYARRHRVAVVAAAGLAIMLVGFSILQAAQLRRTQRERDRAARERDRANRITDFMTGMFRVSDPGQARGNSITAREILDKASKDIDTGLSKDPELQAQLMHIMGTVYYTLGLYPSAQTLLTRAVDIRQRVLGMENPDTLKSMRNLAVILMDQGRYEEAEKLERLTLSIQSRVLGPQHADTLGSASNLALTLEDEGRLDEAERLDRETLDAERRILGPDHPHTLSTQANLAATLGEEGRLAEEVSLERETLGTLRHVLGPENRYALETQANLAAALDAEGHLDEAERLDRETLDTQRRVLGPEHQSTLRSMTNLAHILAREGHLAEAEKLQRQTREIERRVLGPDHPETANSSYNLACIVARGGRRNEAFALLREAVDHGLPAGTDIGIEKDPDLQSLHGDPRLLALVAYARQKAAAAQKP